MLEKQNRNVFSSVIWSAIDRFSAQGVSFLLSIVIARLISPSDYGLIAMLGIFLAIAEQFTDSGFSNALVQKKNRTNIDFSTVFYSNLIIAVVIYAVLFAIAPWIADFYSEPQLTLITRWIGLTVIFMAFSIVQRAKLTIELNFKSQAKISLISVVVSGALGIGMAWHGYGVWALVVQMLVKNFINSLLLCVFGNWKLQYAFSWTSFRSLFSFGSKLLIVGVLHVFYSNIYTLIIGKKFGVSDAGYFNRSQTLAYFPAFNLSSVISRVIYPLQCEMQDNAELLKLSLLNYQRLAIYITAPIMVGMAVFAEPLIRIILSEKWIFVAEFLPILCLAYIWTPIWFMNWQILNVRGRSDLSLKVEIIMKILSLIILITSIPFGIKIICWGLVLSSIVDVIVVVFYVKKIIEINYVSEIKSLLPVFVLASATGVIMYISSLFIESSSMKLFVGCIAGISSYFFLSFLFKFKEFNYIQRIIKQYGNIK